MKGLFELYWVAGDGEVHVTNFPTRNKARQFKEDHPALRPGEYRLYYRGPEGRKPTCGGFVVEERN